MDRAFLEQCLAAGQSLEHIGRETGRHPSTVAYWLRKHGLKAVNRERCSPRGGIAREVLEELIDDGLTQRKLAEALGVSVGTVRHWLARYALTTAGAAKRRVTRAHRDGRDVLLSNCRQHGETEFFMDSQGHYRCLRCRLCGYDRCVAALQFHHLDPASKRFGLAYRGAARALATTRKEAGKCVLLCANCHAEVEAKLVDLTLELAGSSEVSEVAQP